MRIYNCRLCNSKNITEIVNLGFHPLADTFLPPEVIFNTYEKSYPLELGLCNECGHVFTMFVVAPEERYQKNDYSYDSSNSKVAIEHFKEFAIEVIKELGSNRNGLIVDIGSNIGTLLQHFYSLGHKNIIGIEPSLNISNLANINNIPTLNDFFCDRVIKPLQDAGPVKALVSANVLNHADALGEFFDIARHVLAEDGVFVFEVPYVLDLIENTAFDTIYHEHVHYHSLQALSILLNSKGFSIYKVQRSEYMCGSIRVFTRIGTGHSFEVESMIETEIRQGIFKVSTWYKFMNRVKNVKKKVLSDMAKIKNEGGKIIAIGAATKGNTFLNYCRLDGDTISYITDTSTLKIGKLTPGSHIPILNDSDIDEHITHALILPWNIADMLCEKLSYLNLKFYIPQVESVSQEANH